MYKYCFCLVALLALLLPGCTDRTGQIQASLGKEFALYLGQSAVITGEDLEITFQEVTEDSRCPRDVICGWQGRVTCIVQITRGGTSDNEVLTEPGLTEQYTQAKYKEYQIDFQVTPYPEAEKEISPEEYRLHLIINR